LRDSRKRVVLSDVIDLRIKIKNRLR